MIRRRSPTPVAHAPIAHATPAALPTMGSRASTAASRVAMASPAPKHGTNYLSIPLLQDGQMGRRLPSPPSPHTTMPTTAIAIVKRPTAAKPAPRSLRSSTLPYQTPPRKRLRQSRRRKTHLQLLRIRHQPHRRHHPRPMTRQLADPPVRPTGLHMPTQHIHSTAAHNCMRVTYTSQHPTLPRAT